ncbi:ECF RNA polymerase sigma factor SigW [Mariniflexile rhizosphaerae]|uniref:RNA polymerase sigma-70 factor n=1 Tax=unclassified Mariniflexile TaxID=2643887 RepID=UPI000CCB90D0|nr:RNA polymerase sigma-70 factor [Mariniflexile sp. TRM1-10]AXP82138.1 ECF RNA polymerase sigma factor SigW [Mariniflexile sp. TRM1-10]PLB20218.1 MAG: RNA polymerase ECF-type sigma factor [Flavobacteriaceae bacterium FS1-H7996/R]
MKQGGKELTLKDYNKLFKSLYPQLCVFAYKYLDSLETSKDIVQEVFIKVWEDRTVFHDEGHTTGYFYKAVRNKCLNHLKSKQHLLTERYGQENMEIYGTEEFLMSEAVIVETTVIIEDAIRALPVKAAQVIRLSIKDYTNDEIAKALSISVNTVKDHKKVAYRKLRKLLGFLRQVLGFWAVG